MKSAREDTEKHMDADGLRERRLMAWAVAISVATIVVVLGGCAAGPPRQLEKGMPAFPWPPPQASAETTIPPNWLPTGGKARLADVANHLERSLYAAKYPRWSYSSVPNGFALVSQMEQIADDGTPSPEPARWSTKMPRVDTMTLLEFIKALANAQPGYYRVIVFIITDQPWPRTSGGPTGRQAERWLAEGFTRLPEYVGGLPYGPAHKTTALVYEFKKVSGNTDATFLENSPTRAAMHLEKAGISAPLSGL